jgi:ankyrin repeat protein
MAAAKGEDPTQDPVFMACMPSMIEEAKADGMEGEEAELAAAYMCTMAVAVCRDKPSSDACKNSLRDFPIGPSPAGPSILYRAAEQGRAKLIKTLIDIGANPNAPESGPGFTPLMIAAAEGHESCVSLLLDAGANPNATNKKGRTALMFASSNDHLEIVRALLKHKADPDVIPDDETGWTALMAAAQKGHSKTMKILLDSGATASIQDKSGHTALDLAENAGHRKAARMLKKASEKD